MKSPYCVSVYINPPYNFCLNAYEITLLSVCSFLIFWFPVRSVCYQKEGGDEFFSELIVFLWFLTCEGDSTIFRLQVRPRKLRHYCIMTKCQRKHLVKIHTHTHIYIYSDLNSCYLLARTNFCRHINFRS
jgi:hypothetical protein